MEGWTSLLLRAGGLCFDGTATTETYTLSLHDALPICAATRWRPPTSRSSVARLPCRKTTMTPRSEEHTSELQSLRHLVCRLLLEKKNVWACCCFRPP